MADDRDWLARLASGKVLAELEAFTREGRHEYLKRRDLLQHRARSYHILHGGERCDMKAIARAAGGFPHHNPQSTDVAERLKVLGFDIAHKPKRR